MVHSVNSYTDVRRARCLRRTNAGTTAVALEKALPLPARPGPPRGFTGRSLGPGLALPNAALVRLSRLRRKCWAAAGFRKESGSLPDGLPGKIKPRGQCVQVPTLEGRAVACGKGHTGQRNCRRGWAGKGHSRKRYVATHSPAMCKQCVYFL